MTGSHGTILLSNPLTSKMLSYTELKEEVYKSLFLKNIFKFHNQLCSKVGTVFGLQGRSYVVVHSGVELDQSVDVAKLNGATLAVCLSGNDSAAAPVDGSVCS